MAPRSEMLSLLRAAKEAPGDALRRLVLADWLEEHGDDIGRQKAAFLRTRTGGGDAAPERLAEWYPLLTKLRLRPSSTPEGLVAVDVPARKLVSRHAAELVDSEEWVWVSALTVGNCTVKGLVGLVESGLFSEAASLTLWAQERLGETAAEALSLLPEWGLVRQLRLESCSIEAAGCRRLLRLRVMPQLTALNLADNYLSPSSLPDMADAPFESLRELGLARNRLREGHVHLARARWLNGLRGLNLAGGAVSAAGLQELLCGDLSSLEWLDLSWNVMEGNVGHVLARAGSLVRLNSLALDQTRLGNEGLSAIARSPLMPRLKELRLFNCGVTSAGLHSLDEAPAGLSLESLDVGGKGGDNLARAIAESAWAANLKTLMLVHCGIGDAGADALARSTYLGKLKKLDITGNCVGNDSVARLRERFGEEAVLSN